MGGSQLATVEALAARGAPALELAAVPRGDAGRATRNTLPDAVALQRRRRSLTRPAKKQEDRRNDNMASNVFQTVEGLRYCPSIAFRICEINWTGDTNDFSL